MNHNLAHSHPITRCEVWTCRTLQVLVPAPHGLSHPPQLKVLLQYRAKLARLSDTIVHFANSDRFTQSKASQPTNHPARRPILHPIVSLFSFGRGNFLPAGQTWALLGWNARSVSGPVVQLNNNSKLAVGDLYGTAKSVLLTVMQNLLIE
ncbi:unnamed protein product [Protopolystoma xenopodis]|uniref:Uncharacterized protein n=1 Tax=Protopolystoma xenopodis TaxID=117903 RepID=A0A448WLH8_9PLAT|nr:unnamed protein product [Protopolystoma xenopodis]